MKTEIKILKRAILLMWCLLIVCFAIKLLGGEWFKIASQNQRFIAVCNAIDNNMWLQAIVYFPLFVLSNGLTVLAMTQKMWFSRQELYFVISTFIICHALQYIIEFGGIISSVMTAIVVPMVLLGKFSKKWWNILIGNVLIIVFQFLSMIVKELSLIKFNETSLTAIIYMIDAYIMMAIYYLYANLINKKGKIKNE